MSPALPGEFLSTGPPRKSKEGALSSKILCVAIVSQLECGQRQSTSIFKIQQLTQRSKVVKTRGKCVLIPQHSKLLQVDRASFSQMKINFSFLFFLVQVY